MIRDFAVVVELALYLSRLVLCEWPSLFVQGYVLGQIRCGPRSFVRPIGADPEVSKNSIALSFAVFPAQLRHHGESLYRP